MTSRWDEAKRIPIDQVAQRLGVSLANRSVIRCPFPNHSDKNASFSINRRTNLCYCHACGRGGSVIDFTALMTGRTASEAVTWLTGSFGRNIPSRPNASSIASPKSNNQSAALEEFSSDPTIYASLLSLCPSKEHSREYLLGRGISDTIQRNFQIGFIDNKLSTLNRLLEIHGRQAVVRAGLIYPSGRPELVFPSASILFPFFVNEKIVYFQSRTIDPTSFKRWIGLNGVRKAVYNVNAINNTKTVYICEGVTDVLSASELGLPAIGLTGANTDLPLSLLSQLKNKTVYVIPDKDDAGQLMANRLSDLFRKARIQAVIQKLPVGNDLNDYLLKQRKFK